MKNVNKIIKFRKEDDHRYPFEHYIGILPQSNQKLKKNPKPPIQVSPIQNHKKIIKPINKNQPLNYDHLISPEQKAPKHINPLSHLQESDYTLSDNEDFVLSSVKKKTEKVKLSVPKMFEDIFIIQNYRDPALNAMKRGEAVMAIDEIFSMEIMQRVMGVVPEEQRVVLKGDQNQAIIVQEKETLPKMKAISVKHQPEYINGDKEQKFDLEIVEQKNESHQSDTTFKVSRPKSPYQKGSRTDYDTGRQIEIEDESRSYEYDDENSSEQDSEKCFEMDFFNSQMLSYGLGMPQNEFTGFGGYNQRESYQNEQQKVYRNARKQSWRDKNQREGEYVEDNVFFGGKYNKGQPGGQLMGFRRERNEHQGGSLFSKKKSHYQGYQIDGSGRDQSHYTGSERWYPIENSGQANTKMGMEPMRKKDMRR